MHRAGLLFSMCVWCKKIFFSSYFFQFNTAGKSGAKKPSSKNSVKSFAFFEAKFASYSPLTFHISHAKILRASISAKV